MRSHTHSHLRNDLYKKAKMSSKRAQNRLKRALILAGSDGRGSGSIRSAHEIHIHRISVHFMKGHGISTVVIISFMTFFVFNHDLLDLFILEVSVMMYYTILGQVISVIILPCSKILRISKFSSVSRSMGKSFCTSS